MKSDYDAGYIRDILKIFFSNSSFIRRIFILCFAFSCLVPVFSTQQYITSGEIIVLSKKIAQGDSDQVTLSGRARYIPVSVTDMETENSIIRSLPLIRETVTELYNDGLLNLEPGFFD
ncbi:MAG: hypothetical protein JKY01_09485 [Pseudomonadales bacterium]|nr:hypothetical protein [Pseudomonadales bacterium]